MCGREIYLRIFNLVTWILLLIGCQVTAIIQNDFPNELNPVHENVSLWHQRDTRVASRAQGRLACERTNINICEEPPGTVPPDARKTCNYRNVRYHEQVFRWVAGRGCLLYTPDFLFVAGVNTINLNAGCFYGNWFAPCLEIAKDDGTCGCYPFDPGLEDVAAAVREAMVPAAHERWERCFYAASDCCSHYMPEEHNGQEGQCDATFDGWTCWQEVAGGTLATEVCAEFAYSNAGPSCHHYSSKQCHTNGTWELQTDYATCSITPRLLRRYRYHIGMLAFSVASCVPAVFIFFFYKRLRITRVILHRNLLIAIIMRNVFVIVSRSEVYIDELTNAGDTVMTTNGVACRVLAFAERFTANAVFVCMLVEGIYLHRSIVTIFRQKLKIRLLYVIGFVIAVVPALAWALVMALRNDHSCWLVYTVPYVQWVLDVPRIAILLINTALFIDVLRVLLTKIRNPENTNQLSTTKATLFLMPLFGTHFLLTALRPNTTDCNAEQIYYYVAYTVEGLQGFIVAMLYCYVNKEVHMLIKATYKKTETAVVSRIRRDSTYPRMSTGPINDRRMTYTTGLPSDQVDNNKDQYATIRPKLHVAEIISIQASERLAEILEPVYETIQNGVTNEGYDSLDRSDIDDDSGFIPNRDSKVEEYYGFTNVSSISIDCQDWIRCVSSPSSSVYNNSLNDYETKYLEKKFPNHPKITRQLKPEPKCTNYVEETNIQTVDVEAHRRDSSEYQTVFVRDDDYEECENMLDEILQYIETTESKQSLDQNNISVSQMDDDKVVFIN